ncbi:hypothetical protein FW778_03325 [Ginsengibacter hankyongi]|uniref:DUF5777 domain-containing protein n=1 Tax=Ginsengibacter hankyongi TaxID=2607284 RepID=A0A5J5IJ37_9BACT|nr:DUF5777 family beta-barrel protein [Ginsengibacter hankyongi]KAA9041085.1 hypothetical protein FW778_03325 [Ginsengibacter hankyongi]
MKRISYTSKRQLKFCAYITVLLFMATSAGFAQADSTADAIQTDAPVPMKHKPVKNTFNSVWILDNQTVMVPVKGTFEADIQHRFGTVENGAKDVWGIYASANMRIGFNYAPVNNLYLGFGLTKNDLLWDGSAKYAIIKQTKGKYPVSVTYYGNIGYKSIADPSHFLFTYQTERFSFFNELLVARKVSDKLSVQVGAGISHQNSVPGYYAQKDTTTFIYKKQKFDMFTASVCARYQLTGVTAIIIGYDQPLTRFPTDNPHPNLAFGFEFNTSGHTFQLFAGNYSLLNPQQNSLYNANNPFGFTQTGGTKVKGGQFLIGFNITRLWNF